MLAVQAQDYAGARWALAQRTANVDPAAVDAALAGGGIVRTHVLRPTWHLVVAADLRWLLDLTSSRVKAQAAYGNRQSGLDESIFARSNRALAGALQGGRRLTRIELRRRLHEAGISPRDAVGFGHLMLRAELDRVVCSGGLRGNQHTYALFDEVVPPAPRLDRDAALAQLAGRFVASHGPAGARDLAWWAGLSIAEARAGLRSALPPLEHAEVDGATYWFSRAVHEPGPVARTVVHLLPNFDEYTVGYTDRSAIVEAGAIAQPSRFDLIGNVVLVGGRVAGTWKRTLSASVVGIAVAAFRPLTAAEHAALDAAAERYASFLGRQAQLTVRW